MDYLGYLRLSKDDLGDAASIDTQRHLIQDWADRNGHRILAFYEDRNVSGGVPFEDRPGWSQLWADVKRLKAHGVVCLCLDRFVRDLRNQLNMLFDMGRAKVELQFVQHNFDDSPEGWMMLQIHGVFSEWYRRNIGKKIKDRQVDLHSMGLWSCGRLPLGYRTLGKGYVGINEDRAADACAVFETFIEQAGNRNQTALALIEKGVPTRDNSYWRACTVANIIKHPIYRGMVAYKGVEVPGIAIPTVVPLETAETAYRLLQSTTKHRSRNTHTWIYSGWLTCAHCGRRYIGNSAHRTRLYQCGGRVNGGGCVAKGIVEKKIDAMVGKAIAKLLAGHSAKLVSYKAPADAQAPIRDTSAAQARLVDLYESGIITREDFMARMERYQAAPVVVAPPPIKHGLDSSEIKSLARDWPDKTRDYKRKLLALLVQEITLDTMAQTITVTSEYYPKPIIIRG